MKYKCAIIGLGRIGCGFDDDNKTPKIHTHAGAYTKCSKTKLVALCDIDKKKLKKYSEKYGISKKYQNYHEMFKQENIDIISICTDAKSHLPIVKAAVTTGIKGIFVEKPISDTNSDAKEIIKICNKNSIILQVDHQRRFSKFYYEIRENLSKEKIGEIQSINIFYGSGIINTGTHLMDLIRLLFGEIMWVEGFLNEDLPSEKDPNIDGLVGCKNGTICRIKSLDLRKFRVLEFDIIGTKGRFRIDWADSTAKYYSINKKSGLVYTEIKEKKFSIKENKEHLLLGLENIITCIQKKSQPLCTGWDGYRSLISALSLISSSKHNGKRIMLPAK